MRDLAQLAKLLAGNHVTAQLQLQIGDDGAQVGVAAAFADAVDGTLDLPGAVFDGDQAVRYGKLRVIVAVDSQRRCYGGADGVDGGGDVVRHSAAVGIAQTNEVGAALGSHLATLQSKRRICEVAVEEVLGVEDHLVDALLEESNAVVDDFEVLGFGNAQIVADVKVPRLAEDRHHWSFGPQQHLQIAVAGGFDAGAAGGPECRQSCLLQRDPLDGLEKGLVTRVRSRPAALDIPHAEIVQAFGDAQLVLDGEGDVFRLAAVAQGRIVDLDFE
jgi:hypothetical protein